MIRIGVVGLGMMGSTHLDAYNRRTDVRVVAVADRDPDLLHGRRKATGNVEGQAQGGVDLSSARKYADGMELLADPDVDAVDICLPTPLHRSYAEAALSAGKHVFIEKPLARTSTDAFALAALAEQTDRIAMVGMCMRFWPGWDWLREATRRGDYGRVLAAHFRRVTSHPGGRFYSDGAQCGGAILDLHIHDTDFIHYCFGPPEAVFSRGYAAASSEPDHVTTHYLYDDGPMITAEGGWAMTPGFGFQMQYTANFERATAVFDMAAASRLTMIEPGKPPYAVALDPALGYDLEIGHFLECIRTGRKPEVVSLHDAARSIQIVEAERESVRTGDVVRLHYR